MVMPVAHMSAEHEYVLPSTTSGGEYRVVPWAMGSTSAEPEGGSCMAEPKSPSLTTSTSLIRSHSRFSGLTSLHPGRRTRRIQPGLRQAARTGGEGCCPKGAGSRARSEADLTHGKC